MDADRENGSDREERGHEIGAAIAEKRKRHALGRQRLADDAEIEHRLEENQKRHADHQKAPEPVGSLAGNIDRQRKKQRKHQNRGDGVNKPQLLRADGENKIGMRLGEIGELMDEMGIDIPVFGMVKDDYHKTRALCTDTEEISIARENSVFVFIYKLQEEVHRFTVSKMSNAKVKTVTKSSLTKISGIGDAKAKLLLKHFGGLTGVKNACIEELSSVKGISRNDAENIISYFKK